ncbi:MAG: hypothetical protein AB8G99_20605 [Planctomycetaceae bacterium]
MPAKPKADDVVKIFKGLAIAASRAQSLAKEFGRETLRESLSRHQQDAVRQSLLDVENDIASLLKIMTKPKK